MRVIRKAVVMGAVVAALSGAGAGTALADPVVPPPPPLTHIEGVGSDTITPLFDQITTDYNNTSPANGLDSWDAVNPSTGAVGDTIVTKGSSASDTSCSMARPDGSSAGITALEANQTDATQVNGQPVPCIDYARSSRKPVSTDPSTIVFDALNGDAITWATPLPPAGGSSPVPATLTQANLVSIYSCTVTNWDQVGGANAPIVPVLPQNGSGTRASFLLALGGGTTPLTPGVCVVNGSNPTGPLEENTGLTAPNVAQFDPSGVPAVDDVVPYSVGDFIAQGPAANGVGGHATGVWGHGVLGLHSMTNSSGTVEAPTTTNSSGQVIINRSFPSTLQRLLYVVMRNGGTASAPALPTTPSYEATALPLIFGKTGFLCANATAQADEISYGFFLLGAQCGSLQAG